MDSRDLIVIALSAPTRLINLPVALHQRPAICMRASRPRVLRWASPFRPSCKQSHPTILGLGERPFRSRAPISAQAPHHQPPSNIRSFSSSQQRRFMLDADSTIYALSTAPGRAAIAVVRISGPACASVRIFIQAESAFPAAYTDNGPPSRYTSPYVLTNPCRNHALRHYAHYTTPRTHLPQTPS
jgi:hypothetical protein